MSINKYSIVPRPLLK